MKTEQRVARAEMVVGVVGGEVKVAWPLKSADVVEVIIGRGHKATVVSISEDGEIDCKGHGRHGASQALQAAGLLPADRMCGWAGPVESDEDA